MASYQSLTNSLYNPSSSSSFVTTGGNLTLTDTTQSTDITTGALIVSGGAGIAKDVFIGGNLTVAGTAPGGAEFTATSLKTADYTAVSGDWVICDANAATGDIDITLPATPSVGDAVKITLVTAHATRKITINRNSSTIDGGTAAEFQDYNILWKAGDTVTFRCGASSAWLTSERQIANRFLVGCTLATDMLNLTGGAWTIVLFATETYDYNNNFATNAYTAPISGIYCCNGQIRYTTHADGDRMLGGFFVDGVETKVNEEISQGVDPCNVGLLVDLPLTAGEVLTFRALPNTGLNTTDITDLDTQTFFSARLVARI